jgi:hypothetical protein
MEPHYAAFMPAPETPPPRRDPPGLCASCRHKRDVPNTRGSMFSLCQRSREDPAYPRYPRLPVLDCCGHEPKED